MKILSFLAIFCAATATAAEYLCYSADCTFEEQGCTLEDLRRSELGVQAEFVVEQGRSATLIYGRYPNQLVHRQPFDFVERRSGRDFYHRQIRRDWWAWFDLTNQRPFNFKGDWSEERDLFLAVNLKLEDPLSEYFICEAK